MLKRSDKLIVLTNDDGIVSPGLLAAAESLSDLGEIIIAAPREQMSSTGRSMPLESDHKIEPVDIKIAGRTMNAFAVGGTPAQVVQHAVLEICTRKPDLIVSGINYGENFGTNITVSGTIGAAIEGAAFGIPSIAISLQLLRKEQFYSYEKLDFTACAHFTKMFARMCLNKALPSDVDFLKIEVPNDATIDTPWKWTRQAKHRYYSVEATGRKNWSDESSLTYHNRISPDEVDKDTDIFAVLFDRMVSVTPLSLDMTSRTVLNDLQCFAGE